MIHLLIEIINATPDAIRFALLDIPKYHELLSLLADVAGLTLYEDGSIG